jgi:nucleoside-diphosphate-sugar epimerase
VSCPLVRRVLVTGGAGTIGSAVVRILTRDPAWDLRVSDQREAPRWMHDTCEVCTRDLRSAGEAGAAADGCTDVVHPAAIVGGIAKNFHKLPHTLLELNTGLYGAVFGCGSQRGHGARPRLIDGVRKGHGGEIHCRSSGSGEQTRTLTHIDDIADGIVTAMVHPAGENVDVNISASRRSVTSPSVRRSCSTLTAGAQSTSQPAPPA